MGSPAPGSPFPVGMASRLLVSGEMLAPWNDRGAPGVFSSFVKPPHPFPALLLPMLSRRVYNLCCKPVFGLVLAGLQAVWGPWWGSASLAAVDPTPSKASIPPGGPQPAWPRVSPNTLPSPLSPAQPPMWLHLPAKAPTASGLCLVGQSPWSLAADHNTLLRPGDHHQPPLLPAPA